MKKYLTLIVFAFFAFQIQAQTINWVSIEEAVELQKKNPKKIIMDVYTKWCGPCKLLDKKTLQNPDVVDYVNKHFYAVKFNAEGNDAVTFEGKTYDNPGYDPARANKRNSVHKFARYLGIRSYPSIVFMDEDQNLLTKITGFQSVQNLEIYLTMFKNDDHKKMTTQEDWNNYYQNFDNKFSGD